MSNLFKQRKKNSIVSDGMIEKVQKFDTGKIEQITEKQISKLQERYKPYLSFEYFENLKPINWVFGDLNIVATLLRTDPLSVIEKYPEGNIRAKLVTSLLASISNIPFCFAPATWHSRQDEMTKRVSKILEALDLTDVQKYVEKINLVEDSNALSKMMSLILIIRN